MSMQQILLQATPLVLSMSCCKLKLVEEKSKSASLAQLLASIFAQFAEAGKRHSKS